MKVEHLADYPHFIPQIAKWNLQEWPSYYDGKLDKAVEYHTSTATKGLVPTCLVAIEQDALAGTVSLVEEDMNIRPLLTPWLASLYVAPSFRGRGVARQLVEACMEEARLLGISQLYVWTEKLGKLFESCGWSPVETLSFLGASVELLTYKYDR